MNGLIKFKQILTLLVTLVLLSSLVFAVGSAGKTVAIEDVPEHIVKNPNFQTAPVPAQIVTSPNPTSTNTESNSQIALNTQNSKNTNSNAVDDNSNQPTKQSQPGFFTKMFNWLFGR